MPPPALPPACLARPVIVPLVCMVAAGYRQGSVPLPEPPTTRSVEEFRKKGMGDTAMLQAALKWAHAQPVTKGAPHSRCRLSLAATARALLLQMATSTTAGAAAAAAIIA